MINFFLSLSHFFSLFFSPSDKISISLLSLRGGGKGRRGGGRGGRKEGRGGKEGGSEGKREGR